MDDKKQYYGLDEIGFVGTQDKKPKEKTKKDIELTVRYIKALKSKKAVSKSAKSKVRLVKAKY